VRVTINHVTHEWLRRKGAWALAIAAIAVLLVPVAGLHKVSAADTSQDFSIQVSPSPLAITLKPGVDKTATLSVRNVSNHSETLYPRLNGFTIGKHGDNIKLLETVPANMSSWVSFNENSLNLPAGSTKQLTVSFNTPADVGFSYNAAITLSRTQGSAIEPDGLHLRGSVAIFCLVNIDRPDAKSLLDVSNLAADRGQYQFLPAHFTLNVENKGNIIGQPTGSLFIQRSYDSTKPIATLPINAGGNYVLPGTDRSFSVDWNSGFPAYVRGDDGQQHLSWDWKHLNELRFGRYVAKAVVVYNDGKRDVPVITSTVFWVIPWTLIIAFLIVAFLLVMGIVGWGRLLFNGTRKVRSYAARRK